MDVPDPITSLPTTATPPWSPVTNDLTTEETDDALEPWLRSLRLQSAATVLDNLEEQLYSQAQQALIDRNEEPTPDAIEAWVTSAMANHN